MVHPLLALKSLTQLGPRQTGWYLLYQAGLRSGLWQHLTPTRRPQTTVSIQPLLRQPSAAEWAGLPIDLPSLLAECSEITSGRVRLFGANPLPPDLSPTAALRHWTAYERGQAAWGAEDPKLIWEPARFGWVFPLARAYSLTGNEIYPHTFWRFTETFLAANPTNQGPNWVSAQEVALRLIAILYAAQVFATSPETTPARNNTLAAAAAESARRIPPTLSYARAQNNNHLISEALGLYAAGICLPGLPEASSWLELGWKELNHALRSQIAPDGTYSQHSTNYHRLMLQAVLLADALARTQGRPWPPATLTRLQAASRWLLAQLDSTSGRVPNLGSNDGAHILPLAGGGFHDYRPTLQAAARAFLGGPCLPPGPWDELSLRLNLSTFPLQVPPQTTSSPAVHRLGTPESWASLRAVRFTSRPSHADQLQVELWQSGHPLLLDAGTYRYTASDPWNNVLASSLAHNAVMVDGLEPMTRAGKFLWLDWDQAHLLPAAVDEIYAEHTGWQRLGLLHRRRLARLDAGVWQVTDELLPMTKSATSQHAFSLHWLLPDWPWQFSGSTLTLTCPVGGMQFRVQLAAVHPDQPLNPLLQLLRAGQAVFGGACPSALYGWTSPTYNQRVPALSLLVTLQAAPPLVFTSTFTVATP